jgi:hypothetical protein
VSVFSLWVADADVVEVASVKLILRRPNAVNGAANRVGAVVAVAVDVVTVDDDGVGGDCCCCCSIEVSLDAVPLFGLHLDAACCNAINTIFCT